MNNLKEIIFHGERKRMISLFNFICFLYFFLLFLCIFLLVLIMITYFLKNVLYFIFFKDLKQKTKTNSVINFKNNILFLKIENYF